MTRALAVSALACAAAAALSFHGASAAQTPAVDFVRDVQPIFRQRCFTCHGPAIHQNGFRLDRRSDAMRGGTIAVIGAGNSAGSRMYLRLIGSEYGQQMPPTGALPPEEVRIIKDWIDQGAPWPDSASGEAPPPPPDPRAVLAIGALRRGDRARFSALASQPGVAGARGPGGTPLMYAALYGDAALVRRLLDAGADPNGANDAGSTALMWAVDDLAKAQALVEHGANVNAKTEDGRTVLMAAAGLHGGESVVKLLLDHGAKPEGVALDSSALFEAAVAGDPEILRLLMDAGAAAKPIAVAVTLQLGNCVPCAELLVSRLKAGELSAALPFASPPFGDALGLPFLFQHGAEGPGGIPNPGDLTLLMQAASSDVASPEIVQGLIARGADVNSKSRDGLTALDFAKLRGSTAVVDLLEKLGAKAEAPPAAAPGRAAPAPSVRSAVERSLPLLQRSDVTFLKKSGCVSCHNNTLTAMTVSRARSKGLHVDEQIARDQVAAIRQYLDGWRERALVGAGIPGDQDTVSYILLGLAAEGVPADDTTGALAQFLMRRQLPDGRWRAEAHRPPIESSDVEVTAAAIRSLQVYAPPRQRQAYDASIRRAAKWLEAATPAVNEDRAFQLLGFAWTHASRPAIEGAARALAAQQRADGGWSQLPTLQSDAYATGQAIVALIESGARTGADPAVQRGIRFLMNTQLEDGSWFVRTRALPIQPYFESGFPHGASQFISAAATNWATMALALAAKKAT